MNTGHHNTHGRVIYRGPRGGEYVLGAGGRKIRSFTRATAPAAAAAAAAPAGNRNTHGRIIHRGPRGGEYVLGPGGRKIRSFTRATAAAAAAAPPARSTLNNAKAHMNTLPSIAARKAYLRSRAANMANANWHALNRYKQHLNYTEPLRKKLAAMIKLSNTEYIDKYGELYNNQARMKFGVSNRHYNNTRTRAFNMKPKFLQSHLIPYVGPNRPNDALMKKHKLKNSTVMRSGKTLRGNDTWVHKKVYFNRHGLLYFLTLNGRKNSVIHASQNYRVQPGSRNLRQLKRAIGMSHPNYPRSAIPPVTPALRRSSPELINNILQQIYPSNGAIGRGINVNAERYTAEERNVLARRLSDSIRYFKQHRDAKKEEAIAERTIARNPSVSTGLRAEARAKAAAANERVMYYDDAVLAYTRGLRAVKPLTGVVTPRARAMPNTPNRYTPAAANVTENMAYANLTRPHLVVKTPGVGVIYLSPNTFRGLVKNSARVNIAPANVRNWLRTARRNFPNEKLFRHPFAPKNVTASHIRFSRV